MKQLLNIYLKGHQLEYEAKEIINLFFNKEEVSFVGEAACKDGEILLISELEEGDNEITVTTQVVSKGRKIEKVINKQISNKEVLRKKQIKRAMKIGIIKVLSEFTGKETPWGILTGIRPTKAAQELLNQGYTESQVIDRICEDFGAEKSKATLMIEVAKNEMPFLKDNSNKAISIYIGIPFCPDKCLYCSFPSSPIKRYRKTIDSFMLAIGKEIIETAKLVGSLGWKVETIYFGGGTPTSLGYEELNQLFKLIAQSFDLSDLIEYTVEAGRPDTINKEKLELMKKHGITRISINPQTMNDVTLRTIGRNHTVDDIKKAFELVRENGFDNVNADIIVGLPGEDLKMLNNTLQEIQALKPESLTVHTLAIKKGSKLNESKDNFELPVGNDIDKMIDLCREKACEMGMKPYYLYRQKNMVGEHENIGYSLEGKECIYNIKMIEEVQNIFAIGPGAVSRVLDPKNGAIEKIFNDRSIEGYILRIDEMIKRKYDGIDLIFGGR